MKLDENLFKDIKLLQSMFFRITKYQNKKCDITDLINGVENYLNQLTTIDENTKTDLRTLWLNLEIVYALSLERDDEMIYQHEYEIMESTLTELKKLIIEKHAELEDLVEFTPMVGLG